MHDEKIPEYKKKVAEYVDGIEPEMTLHNFLYGRSYNKVNKTNERVVCERPTKTVIIRWNGDVVACCFDFDSVMVLGNVRENTIQEIVNSERYQNFCNKLKRRRYNQLPYCNICDQPEPYTLVNRLKRFYYLHFKRNMQRRQGIKFYNNL